MPDFLNWQEIIDQLTETLHARYGFAAFLAFELEWYVTPADKEKDIAQLHKEIAARIKELNLGILGIVPEKGVGQFETAFTHRKDVKGLIHAVQTFKDVLAQSAEQSGLVINFAAKPFPDDYGSALQAHISLVDSAGNPLFEKRGEYLSPVLSAALGGLLRILPEAMIFAAPYSQSYARFVPGKDAPVTVSWGGNNRSVALRLPMKNGPFTQIEYRVGGADSDPAALSAVILAGVLYGLEHRTDPGPQIYGNASDTQYRLPRLPVTFEEAHCAYNQGTILKNILRCKITG